MLNLIRRGRRAFPRSKSASGATNINNGVISIDLEKVWLVNEYTIRVAVAQSFTGVPTSSDVRRFFSKIQLSVDKGEGINANFHTLYDISRLTEKAPSPVVTLAAASTAEFSFEIHGSNDGAIGDIVTSWLTGKYSTLTLELTLASKADNGFIGGTVPLEASYNVEVLPSELRDQTPADRSDNSGGWGVAEHYIKQQASISGGVAGFEGDLPLTAGGKVRFIPLHAFNAASGGTLTDAVFLNGARVSMEIDGFKHYDNTPLSSLREYNFRTRNMPASGLVVLDFGDDPKGWPDLRNVKEPKVKLSIPASANLPAAWRIEYAQDATKGLELLQGALNA